MKSHNPSFSVHMVKNSKPVGKVFRKSNKNEQGDKSIKLKSKDKSKVITKWSLNGTEHGELNMKSDEKIKVLAVCENFSVAAKKTNLQSQKSEFPSLSKSDIGNKSKKGKSLKRKIDSPGRSDSSKRTKVNSDNNSAMVNSVAAVDNESSKGEITNGMKSKKRRKRKKKKPTDETSNTYKPVLVVKDAKDISSNWKNLKDIIAQHDKAQAAKLKENVKKIDNQKHSYNKETKKMKKKEKLKLQEMIEEQKKQTAKYMDVKQKHLEKTGKQSKKNKMKQSKENKMDDIWFDNVDPILLGEEYNEKESEDDEVDDQEEENVPEDVEDGDGKAVAIDCEMVGIGINGKESMLARVSVVNQYCRVIYDKYVKPQEPVVDYRTEFSGIRPEDIKSGHDFKEVQAEVAKILNGKILVGHGVDNDLRALFLQHPRSRIRDTARYKPFKKMFRGHTPKLKMLSQKILGVEIQSGEHDSVQDAQAVMRIYTVHKKEWDKMKKKIYQKPSKKSAKVASE